MQAAGHKTEQQKAGQDPCKVDPDILYHGRPAGGEKLDGFVSHGSQ